MKFAGGGVSVFCIVKSDMRVLLLARVADSLYHNKKRVVKHLQIFYLLLKWARTGSYPSTAFSLLRSAMWVF